MSEAQQISREAASKAVRQVHELRGYLDAIAEALHPHKPVGGGWTYLPDQLAGMVRELRERLDKTLGYCEKHIEDWHKALDQRDELRDEVAKLRGLLIEAGSVVEAASMAGVSRSDEALRIFSDIHLRIRSALAARTNSGDGGGDGK